MILYIRLFNLVGKIRDIAYTWYYLMMKWNIKFTFWQGKEYYSHTKVYLIASDNTRQSGDRSFISCLQDKAIKLHEESLLCAYGSIKGQR